MDAMRVHRRFTRLDLTAYIRTVEVDN